MSQLVNYLMKNPTALVNWQNRIMPQLHNPIVTPLHQLIRSIPPMLRRELKGITLHPNLGFTSSARFNNLEQLYTWFGGQRKSYEPNNQPYLQWRIARFNKPLMIEDLRSHCLEFPPAEILKRYGLS